VFIRLVGGQQDGALLVTLADVLEDQVRAGFVDGQVIIKLLTGISTLQNKVKTNLSFESVGCIMMVKAS
jgi:hypothetical protein